MCNSWICARRKYSWTVDLTHFSGSEDYPGFFNQTITPADIQEFEDTFRAAVDGAGSYEVAGEECFWKNYGNFQARNRITQTLLLHLQVRENWINFTEAVRSLSVDPSHGNFLSLRDACNQPRGFATPITFLAFYDPMKYPMVDKHIANWWAANRAKHGYGTSRSFSQRSDGWIQTYSISQTRRNWNAYIFWTRSARITQGESLRTAGRTGEQEM